jgi:hypothetical protein
MDDNNHFCRIFKGTLLVYKVETFCFSGKLCCLRTRYVILMEYQIWVFSTTQHKCDAFHEDYIRPGAEKDVSVGRMHLWTRSWPRDISSTDELCDDCEGGGSRQGGGRGRRL